MAFKYKESQWRLYVRKDSQNAVSCRIDTSKALQRYRSNNTKVVDMTNTFRRGSPPKWAIAGSGSTLHSLSPVLPTVARYHLEKGSGVIADGRVDGFVKGSYLCYLAKFSQGDYHDEINGNLFKLWLTTHLLLLLKVPSVLVLDNASYHSRLTENTWCSTTAVKKDDLVRSLQHLNISISPGAVRSHLLLRRQNRLESQPQRANIIREWSLQVVWLPIAHPELNAIEQVCGCMKRHVWSSLLCFTRADLQGRPKRSNR